MARPVMKRRNTRIDMTAMSDVTVLLLTFFMLTSTFIPNEPVMVMTPASVSEIKIPENNVLQVLIEPSGKIFLRLDKQGDMTNALETMGKNYGVSFTAQEVDQFKLLPTFGVPMSKMKGFLALSSEEQDRKLKEMGIPCDSTDNQFKAWVKAARVSNADLRIAIKADQDTPYSVIKNVMGSLQELRENRYNLITSLKTSTDN